MARIRVSPPLMVDELVVREYTLADVAALDAAIVRNREYLLPWIGPWINDEPIGIERRTELVRTWLGEYEQGRAEAIGIFDDGELVGSTGLHDRNGPADVEIGYWVDQDCQGRGIATRVSRALVDFAFAHPEVQRVLIAHNAPNAKSRRVPEKLGFRQVPAEHCGCGPDTVMWEYTRDMWTAARTSRGTEIRR